MRMRRRFGKLRPACRVFLSFQRWNFIFFTGFIVRIGSIALQKLRETCCCRISKTLWSTILWPGLAIKSQRKCSLVTLISCTIPTVTIGKAVTARIRKSSQASSQTFSKPRRLSRHHRCPSAPGDFSPEFYAWSMQSFKRCAEGLHNLYLQRRRKHLMRSFCCGTNLP